VRHHLYKYFDKREWADAFLTRGVMRFSTLATFRDFEDEAVRGDRHEGTAFMQRDCGITIRNHTQGRTTSCHSVEFIAKHGEIFVYCLSKSASDAKRDRFHAVACVEILQPKAFFRRVQKQLPWKASYAGRPGRERLGHPVEYYQPDSDPNPRWACPDLIATSKLESYAWQDEYRLVFSLTDALRFENIHVRVNQTAPPPRTACPSEHHIHDIEIGNLEDIAVLYDLTAVTSKDKSADEDLARLNVDRGGP
jgi:hypothetical protein